MTDLRSLALFAAGIALIAVPVRAQGSPSAGLDRAHHVLRRATFGPTSSLVTNLQTGIPAVRTFLDEQLNPSAAADPNWPYGSQTVEDIVKPGGTLGLPSSPFGPFTLTQFQTSFAQLAYALDSDWQLREVMCQFWERHFNTALIGQSFYFTPYLQAGQTADSLAWYFEYEANDYYRNNAFGTFKDLLTFTAQHASMMIYLHMPQNDGPKPNEDFARELLELYTCGQELPQALGTPPITNYKQEDIEEVARILTGWDLDESNGFVFQFDDADHDYSSGAVSLFVVSGMPLAVPAAVPPNGDAQGVYLLEQLAGRDCTADFICRKLISYFIDAGVADDPASTLLADMKGEWGTDGDIFKVLKKLLLSAEFLNTSGFRLNRARLPLESVIAGCRAVDAKVRDNGSGLPDPLSLSGLVIAIESQGMSLLRYPAPNGFPFDNASQKSPSNSLERVFFGTRLVFPVPAASYPDIDVLTFVQAVQPALPALAPGSDQTLAYPHLEAVVDHLLTTLYGSNYTAQDESRVTDAILGAIAWIDLQPGAPWFGDWDPYIEDHYTATVRAAMAMALGMVQSGVR